MFVQAFRIQFRNETPRGSHVQLLLSSARIIQATHWTPLHGKPSSLFSIRCLGCPVLFVSGGDGRTVVISGHRSSQSRSRRRSQLTGSEIILTVQLVSVNGLVVSTEISFVGPSFVPLLFRVEFFFSFG